MVFGCCHRFRMPTTMTSHGKHRLRHCHTSAEFMGAPPRVLAGTCMLDGGSTHITSEFGFCKSGEKVAERIRFDAEQTVWALSSGRSSVTSSPIPACKQSPRGFCEERSPVYIAPLVSDPLHSFFVGVNANACLFRVYLPGPTVRPTFRVVRVNWYVRRGLNGSILG